MVGGYYAGVLVGYKYNGSTVNNCYSSGSAIGDLYVGGLFGYNEEEETMSDSFWDVRTSGQTTSAGGMGKTTVEMQDITTFSVATWDIIAVADHGERNHAYIWNIITGQTYTFLSWQA